MAKQSSLMILLAEMKRYCCLFYCYSILIAITQLVFLPNRNIAQLHPFTSILHGYIPLFSTRSFKPCTQNTTSILLYFITIFIRLKFILWHLNNPLCVARLLIGDFSFTIMTPINGNSIFSIIRMDVPVSNNEAYWLLYIILALGPFGSGVFLSINLLSNRSLTFYVYLSLDIGFIRHLPCLILTVLWRIRSGLVHLVMVLIEHKLILMMLQLVVVDYLDLLLIEDDTPMNLKRGCAPAIHQLDLFLLFSGFNCRSYT